MKTQETDPASTSAVTNMAQPAEARVSAGNSARVLQEAEPLIEPENDIGTLELSDMIDTEVLQHMMEDFYRVTGMLGAVLDLSGKVLVAVGWQDICTQFHRCHPGTLKNCIESDTHLTRGVPAGTFKAYRCKNNMWDMVTPLMVGGRHVGNVFLGQFFYEGETLDVTLFREQARRHGFDEAEYLTALGRVPRFSREKVDAGMCFYAKLAELVSTLSYNAIKQSRLLAERKRSEAALRASEATFRAVADLSPMAIYASKGSDQKGLFINKAFYEMFGFSLEDTPTVGQWWIKAFPDEKYRQQVMDQWAYNIEQANKNHTDVEALECRCSCKDGSEKTIAWVGKTLGDEFWAFGYDLTEQKFAEEALRRYAERLQNLHKIDQAILQAIESPETIVHTALQHLCGLLQCERASVGIFELKKKQVRVFAAEVNGERIVQTGIDLAEEAYGDLDILRQGTMEVVEDMSKVPSPPAAARILQVKGVSACINVPLLSVQGLYGALNIGWEEARPITAEEREIAGEAAGQITIAIEQAHLLQETKRYAVELEQRVADRTAQLEAANNELEAFSYSVSHDLRAPLRAIDGYDRILLEDYADRLDDEGRRVLGVISSETHRMGQLVDDLLAFSRMGRQKQEISEIDMTALAQEVFVEHAALAPKRTLQLKLEPLSPARGDRAMLRVVLVNLLSNAIKFTQSRNPAVIEVGSRREDGQTVYYVKDNGVGFDMRYASKLFGVFQRLHSAEDFEGTGVGLALVQRIVHRHGGRVWFEAKVNEGAILFFSLPDMKENL